MGDIFISYATVDRPFARRLADALEARGWEVWWDHRNLRGGQHFDRVIEEAIRGARVVIVVWSKISVESGWVRDEATLALEEGKLVPLRIDMVRLPMRFRNIHTIDLASWTGETEAEPYERLVKDLGHYLGPPTPLNRPKHPGIPTAPGARTAAPVGENQQLVRAPRIVEPTQTPPIGGSPYASTISTWPASTTGPPLRAGRKHVGKYLAAVLAIMGVVWGMMALETDVPKPSDTTGDAIAAQVAYGRGDYATALSLARSAAEHGDQVAQHILGWLYMDGQGVVQDYAEALRWFRKAAEQEDAAAQNGIGVLYQNGWGVVQDYAEALRWYRNAADQRYAGAQNNIGVLYQNGWGVVQDYAEALRWYRNATDQGNTDAQYNISLLYQNGWGVAQDKAQARAWMQKAVAAGNENAKKWLEKNN